MVDVVALIDGFNMYHALEKCRSGFYPYRKCKWINYWRLAECFVGVNGVLTRAILFTAYLPGTQDWHAKKNARHAKLIAANKTQGVELCLGRFFMREKRVRIRPSDVRILYTALEGKRTDVNIAVTLVSSAADQAYDRCLLITADSDLVPAIDEAHARHPTGEIYSVPPIERGGQAKALKKACRARHKKMKQEHLQRSVLPQEVPHPVAAGRTIVRPPEWT